jgi:hypothetical protein
MNLRNALCAAALAVPMTIVGATQSMADTDVDVRFGIGFPGYGYSQYPHYDEDYDYDFQRAYRRLSCWQAKQLVRDHGFHRVRTVECNGRVYTFEARRRGRIVLVNVNSRTGAVWRS